MHRGPGDHHGDNHGDYVDHVNDHYGDDQDDEPALRLEGPNLVGEKLLLTLLRLFHSHRHHGKGGAGNMGMVVGGRKSC